LFLAFLFFFFIFLDNGFVRTVVYFFFF
jgi:hypothetical protein